MTGNLALAGTAALLLVILIWRTYLHGAERRRLLALRRYESLFSNNTDAVASLDESGGILNVNNAFIELTGYDEERVSGTSFIGYIVSEDRTTVQENLDHAWEGRPVSGETLLHDSEGRLLEVKLTTVPIVVGQGVGGVYQIAQDIRLRKEIERKLETQALHDYLTGLPNRALFQDRLLHALERSRRTGDSVALFYIDLDRFKAVNDTAGHGAGDQILRTVAKRLGVFLRGGDTVARLGGDEFAVLMESVSEEADALHVAERITDLLARPIDIEENGEVAIGGSVGIALTSEETRSPEELVRQADMAMYEAKRVGGHRFEVYRPEMEAQHTPVPLQLEADLRRAIENDELTVVYQPVIDLAGTRIVAVEALVRWKHPELGTLTPGQFVPLAEETGLIVPLDRWVLARACSEVRMLTSPGATNTDNLVLSVNYSKLHLENDNSIAAIQQILNEQMFEPSRLQLEITETVAGSDRQKLRDLKKLGVLLAIDDFGTGFSSLAYLQDVNIDVLKVDRSFIRALGEDQSSVAIVRTILTLASVLGLGVIIEGVEEAGQLRQLQELGGRYVQGFYFAEPMDFDELKAVVSRGLPPEWVLRRNEQDRAGPGAVHA